MSQTLLRMDSEELLRHSKLSTTDRYLAKTDQRKAGDAMSKLFGGVE